jgi:hypothetical protein
MNVTVNRRTRPYRTVTFDARRNAVLLIDQRLLPHQFKIAAQSNYRATARAIQDMVVRGAGAISPNSPATSRLPFKPFNPPDPPLSIPSTP